MYCCVATTVSSSSLAKIIREFEPRAEARRLCRKQARKTSQDRMIYGYTSGGIRNTTIGGLTNPNLATREIGQRANVGKEGSYSCVGREAGGITISFQPNRRASSEKAPGPRRAMAAEMAMTGASASFDSNGLNNCSGNQEKAIPRFSRPARRLRIGVRNPIRRQTPLNERTAKDTSTRSVTRSEDSKQRTP